MLSFWILLVVIATCAFAKCFFSSFSKPIATVMTSVCVAAAIGLYHFAGHADQLSQYATYQAKQQRIAKVMKTLGSPQQVIVQLKATLAKHPDSARGWFLLGRIYHTQGQYQDAVDAFIHASQLQKNVEYAAHYLLSSFYAQGGRFEKGQLIMLNTLSQKHPKQVLLNNLRALQAYQLKHYPKAIEIWRTSLARDDLTPNDRQAIISAIARAESANHKG